MRKPSSISSAVCWRNHLGWGGCGLIYIFFLSSSLSPIVRKEGLHKIVKIISSRNRAQNCNNNPLKCIYLDFCYLFIYQSNSILHRHWSHGCTVFHLWCRVFMYYQYQMCVVESIYVFSVLDVCCVSNFVLSVIDVFPFVVFQQSIPQGNNLYYRTLGKFTLSQIMDQIFLQTGHHSTLLELCG